MARQVAAPRAGSAAGTGAEHRASSQSHELSPPDEGITFGVPGRPVRPFEQGLGLGVGHNRLVDGIPAQLPAQAERQVRQVACGGDTVRALQVRDRVAAGPDAFEEVAGVTLELVELVTGTVLDDPGRARRQPRAGPSWPARRPGGDRRTGESLRPGRPWGRASR